MEIKNKNVLVYGGGRSGLSAYKFLNEKGANVFIYSDKGELDESLNKIDKFCDVLKLKFDYVVVSPGIPILGNKNIKKLKKAGALLISELELGYLFCRGKFVAVTGTNGKTTCVNLIYHVLKETHETFLCGNVGIPITEIARLTTENSIVVCEVSSFMLELVSANFKPDISVILNITEDHISRHKTMEEYTRVKFNIARFQTADDYLLLNKDLKVPDDILSKTFVIKPKKYKTKLVGEFNMLNIAFCEKVCEILGVSKKQFARRLKSFAPVDFRLQNIGKKRGVVYINDSKSTNTDSCVKALSAMKKPVILLLGGSDKGSDFKEIFKLKDKLKLVLIYGQTADKLEKDATECGFKQIQVYSCLKETLKSLQQYVKRGDIVLFSPACASYDEFSNYIERGKYFNDYVFDL